MKYILGTARPRKGNKRKHLDRDKNLTWDLVAHPVTQVIGEQALVDILDLFEVAWTCWGVSTPRSGLGRSMVKELDLQLALGMNARRKTSSLPVYDMHRRGVGGLNLGQTQS